MENKIKEELNRLFDKYGWNSIDNIDWEKISKYDTLSEAFMREFKDKIVWEWIAYGDLSEGFMREFKDKLDLEGMMQDAAISKKLYKELTI